MITAQRELLRQEVLVEPVGKTKDVVRVQVRFPSGQKFTRKFALDDSLEVRSRFCRPLVVLNSDGIH